MCFGGGGPSAAEQQRQAEQARQAEAARLAEQQRVKDAETLRNTLAEKSQQAATEAAASAQRQSFIKAAAPVAVKSTLGSATEDELTKKKTLLANYGK
jgi:hypothetical protein